MASSNTGDRPGDDGEGKRLAAAITALAAALAPKPDPPARPGSGVFKAVTSFVGTMLPSIVMFVLGYMFIQGVELDLKREEFTAEAADKLKSYVETLMTAPPNESQQKLRATALALGGFGSVAVLPLINVIDAGGPQKIASGKAGLEQAGRVAPDAACSVIAEVIDDPTGAYGWEARKAVTEVAGLVGCREAVGPLTGMRPKIRSGMQLTSEQQANFERAVDQALERIAAADGRDGPWW